jgi:hypothetical protein
MVKGPSFSQYTRTERFGMDFFRSHNVCSEREVLTALQELSSAVKVLKLSGPLTPETWEHLLDAVYVPLSESWETIASPLDARRPMHTDAPYVSSTDTISVLCCVAPATRLGGNCFLNSHDFASHLNKHHSSLFDFCTSADVVHTRNDLSCVRPIMQFEESSGDCNVAFNHKYCVARESDTIINLIRVLETELREHASVKYCELSCGEVIVWRDALVLHGREASDNSLRSRLYRHRLYLRRRAD